MNRETVISNALLHAQNLCGAIEQNIRPTKEACCELIDDITALCQLQNQKIQKEADNVNIEVLFNDFTQYAETSKTQLEAMLSFISGGRVPSEESVREFNSSIDSLREKYASVYHAALEQLPVEEMPGENAAAGEYVEAVRNSQSLQLKKRLDAAADCLMKFLSVRSLTDKYLSALAPFQDEAKELLMSLQQPGGVDTEQFEEKTSAPGTLVAAIEYPDKDSEEMLDLCEKLDEFYPKRISFGIAKDQYYIDSAAYESLKNNAADAIAPQSLEENSDIQTEATSQTAELRTTHSAEGHAAESGEDASGGENTANIPETSTEETEPIQDSTFVAALKDAGGIYGADAELGTVEIETGSGESKKITSTVFTNEMKQGHTLAEKKIIQALSKRGFVSERYLTDDLNAPADIASSGLAYMLKKGYLRKYLLSPVGDVIYFATPRLVKAITFLDASKFAGVKQHSVKAWDPSDEEVAAGTAAQIVLSENSIDAANRMTIRGVELYTESTHLMNTAFCSTVFETKNPSICEIILGDFWTSVEGCDAFYQSVREAFEKRSRFHAITFSSYDLAHAAAFAGVMLPMLEDLTADAPVYLYSLIDHAYFAYPSLAPVSKEYTDNTPANETVEEEPVSEGLPDSNTEEPTSPEPAASEPESEAETDQELEPELEIESEPESEPEPEIESKHEPGLYLQPESEHDSNGEPTPATPHQITLKKVNCAVKVPEISFEAIKENLFHILSKKLYYAASAYLKSLVDHSSDVKHLYYQLAYALNDPMAHCSYTSSSAFDLITKRDDFEDYLVVATALRMFFSNQVRFDYSIKSFHSSIREYALLSRYPSLGSALYTLVEFKDTFKKGMDAYADYRAKSRTALESEVQSLCKEASNFYENFVVGRKKENCSQKRFLETKTLMFSVSSEFGCYIKAVADDDSEYVSLVAEFLQEYFYSDDSVIAEDNYDANMLWNYIQQKWDEAGERMMYKRHSDLMSRLRSNITNQTVKAVQILARWVTLREQLNDHNDDAGTIQYKKVKKPLQDNLEAALNAISADIHDPTSSLDEIAGLRVLEMTIRRLLDCLGGSYQEHTRKFFYLPFLKTDDVTLIDDLTPDLDVHSSDLDVLHPSCRILMHIQKLESGSISYSDRLHTILDDHGDDYGSATQIAEYFSVIQPDLDIAEILSQIEIGEPYAKQSAEIARTDFIGELELAQSYGQIDSSVEDKKEMILQIVNEWSEWANDTSNYGFFRKVMDTYLQDIKEAAKSRGMDLQEQLEKFKVEPAAGIPMDVFNARIKRVQDMIDAQNYTVAEDYLARINSIEDDTTDYIEEDFLKEFLENYYDYYTPVAKISTSFATLVSNRTRNKEDRGAKRLADNWLPNGSNLGKERLENLLGCLGFKIDTVTPQSRLGKFEHFFVRGKSNENGKRIAYTHPIAALGSRISEDEIRVVCIQGSYDAEGLIDIMKSIGDTKHTIILINTALSISERRRLARKTKNALGEKLFVVIDRTVMMFLVRNYDENKINRMLISLVMPFGYYQPYVADSANVMPPEIFMGRKNELERIKSATGVNIVYGGRQLGKSALLKKAKEDIDWNENGDRAVYIEIRELNYKKAANKIGHELYDKSILEEDIDTTSWDELARALKRRLLSPTARKIPYLLLLIDEADAFIESCEAVNYKPFDALKEIQSIGSGRFKFVVAGLRNVVRFKREAALGNNSVLTHLQSMTVKPFSPPEARELLEIPLHYLGLRFPKEKQSLITLILATTNYFPGMIQLYCTKLLEAMRSKDYAGYSESNTPLYEISEGHIKKVLADPSFTKQIWDKFEITLKLDEDNYYYLIALLMAYLYHNNGYNMGYCAEDIKNAAAALSVDKIAYLSDEKLGALLEELRELNVLRNTDETHYLFTRVSFFQMLGTIGDVEDKLMSYMEV